MTFHLTIPTFRDPSLIARALTHRSYLNEHPEVALEDNERLEFLGDAVLDFVVGAWLYNRFPELPEGRLTSLRAALVKTDTLAGFAVQIGVPDQLRLGKGEMDSGGRARQSLLCNAFEATIGAMYLDRGLGHERYGNAACAQTWPGSILAEYFWHRGRVLPP